MRIVCPSCEAAYDVPAPVVATGRKLRCARCGEDFTPAAAALPLETAAASAEPMPDAIAVRVSEPIGPEPLQPDAVTQAPPAPALVPADRLANISSDDKATQPRLNVPVMAGWILSFAVLAAMAWGFLAWRAPIQRAWPASARVYAILGIT